MSPVSVAVPDCAEAPDCVRTRVILHGAVQGVGFRPFVFRLATELGLTGWIRNSGEGARIEIEGPRRQVQEFVRRLEIENPPHSFIQRAEISSGRPVGDAAFEIRPSDTAGARTALVSPDLATCPECLADIFCADNRRHFYPFTNCTHCGPRFSIIESLPYDRPHTSMRRFPMCAQCRMEYEDPRDRRFHAQPNACPACGPHLELWDRTGRLLHDHHLALIAAVDALRRGAIVAVKGLGGFHLLVDARDENAVRRLRLLKHREAKPLAVMAPSPAIVKALCAVSALEDELLRSPAAPIVLLRRRPADARAGGSPIAPSVAPGNPGLGILLPYTPLHHLLLTLFRAPVVATSGNVAEEPICTDEREALERLRGVADLFLVHNRPIVRPVDDSVVQVVLGHAQVLRRARGYAPLPISLPQSLPPTLAVGAHSKNTVALAVDQQVFVSQHIGDLQDARAHAAFRRAVTDLPRLYSTHPTWVASDAHPDYRSTQHAHATGLPGVSVQHHYGHVLSCMAEHSLDGTVLGVAWDGTGYGSDGTIWGGEFLKISPAGWKRVAHLRTFGLPGGETAVYEPRRTALGVLFELFGESVFAMKQLSVLGAFTPKELKLLKTMLGQRLNTPRTSSVGRIFDAVASLIGLRQIVQFEGQAAMDLEFAVDSLETDQAYTMICRRSREPTGAAQAGDAVAIVDWALMIEAILEDLLLQVPAWEVAAKFHNALAEAVLTVARQIGEPQVVLSGGCFQNRWLTERTVALLRADGFHPYWHQRVPPNDGGIALGQALAAARALRDKSRRPGKLK